jgi:ABC-type multidrug transport system ATPase subunit
MMLVEKRLNIILSILHDPRIVILDEPFAGLDYINRLLLWDFIKHLKSKGKTIVLTTHLLNEAQDHCNNLLIISEGRKFAMGSINDIKRMLSFQEYISFKFNYLNRDDQRRIRNYCKRRGYWILNLNTKMAGFGLPSSSKRKNIIGMIKRLDTPYDIAEYRPPTLNELFMVSIK